jgi:multiple sugar transport system permease protein
MAISADAKASTKSTQVKGRKPGFLTELRRAFGGIRREETLSGYLFLLPNLLGFLTFTLFPLATAAFITFTDWNLASSPVFVGLQNFDTLVHDDLFWKTMGNTFYFTFGAVIPGVFTAFWLAILMNRKMKGVILLRTLYFLPQITLMVAVAMIWSWLYHPDAGLFNFLLDKIGIEGPKWLHSTVWAMPAIILMSNWKGVGWAMLVLLAGLQGIPEEFYEAAEIDGASALQRLWHVTLPMLSPTLFFVVVTSLIGAFQGFDQFSVMTGGGPAYATTTLVMYIYRNGFQWFKMGYGGAIASALFVCILIITLIQWRLARSWVFGFE